MMLAVEKSEKTGIYSLRDTAWHVEFQLENWARWMSGGGKPDAIPDHSHAGENYHSYDEHSESAYEAMDLRSAVICNAAIAGLTPAEQCALHHRYLSAVYRFNRGQYGGVLMMAKAKLAVGLARKGVWLGE